MNREAGRRPPVQLRVPARVELQQELRSTAGLELQVQLLNAIA
jgi:hypothetical protein